MNQMVTVTIQIPEAAAWRIAEAAVIHGRSFDAEVRRLLRRTPWLLKVWGKGGVS